MVVQWVQTISITTKDGIPNFIVDKDRKVNTIKIFWSKIYFSECHDYMNAVIYYNPYYPTHIFATICLWVICKYFLSLGEKFGRSQTRIRDTGPVMTCFFSRNIHRIHLSRIYSSRGLSKLHKWSWSNCWIRLHQTQFEIHRFKNEKETRIEFETK